jgi:hypothetical protein
MYVSFKLFFDALHGPVRTRGLDTASQWRL